MSRKTINRDAVTIKDLEREIADLRTGVRNLVDTSAQFAKANHSLVLECRELRKANMTIREELDDANMEILRQQAFQTRAHETIELLVKKMPYAPQVH